MYENEKERLKKQTSFNMNDLNLIMKILRAKDGCPWDIEQTHESIVPSLIEETYEAVEAIEMKNSDMLKEELGDVLLQVAFHARISEEAGEFNFSDVVADVSQKMIVRHPHVFGDVVAETSGDVLKNWDKIKADTKHQKTLGERLNSIAKPLPALVRTQKVMHKAAKEMEVPTSVSSSALTDEEKAIGAAFCEVLARCEKADLDAETVLRRYCDALIEEIDKEQTVAF